MRNGRTYRADLKRRAKAMGLTLAEYARVEARAREIAAQNAHAAAMAMTPEQARMALGIWAATGGKRNMFNGR